MRCYLSVEDAARISSVSERTIRRWLARGLPHTKVGGEIFIRRDKLKRFRKPQRGRPSKVRKERAK